MSNIEEISDLAAPELDVYARLTGPQLRSAEHNLFIAESGKVIGYALDAGCRPVSLLMARRHIAGKGRDVVARCGDIPVYTADDSLLERLTGFHLTRGILCAMERPSLPAPEEILRNARRAAVLCGVGDAANVGAVFRSAAALNVDAVLVSPDCCDPLSRRAARVSMGAVFQLPWARCGALPGPGVKQLRAAGFRLAAMALGDRTVSVDDPRLMAEERLAILLGAEGDGLPAALVGDCDYAVKIPMARGVDSLNVAAASAVAFWQLCRDGS